MWTRLTTAGSRLRRELWRAKGAHIEGFSGPYRFSCNAPERLWLKECHLEAGIDFKLGPNGGAVVIRERAWLGRNTTINVVNGCDVGAETMIAAGCYLCDFKHGVASGAPMAEQALLVSGPESMLTVGRDAWIGANAVVAGCVRIGNGAVIGALSFVNRSVPDYEIWAGVPARKIGERR